MMDEGCIHVDIIPWFARPKPIGSSYILGNGIRVLCGKYNRRSMFAVEICGFVPHNIIPEE
jgi:hypothetical protein